MDKFWGPRLYIHSYTQNHDKDYLYALIIKIIVRRPQSQVSFFSLFPIKTMNECSLLVYDRTKCTHIDKVHTLYKLMNKVHTEVLYNM